MDSSQNIKLPCFFTVVIKNGKETISAICLECQKSKKNNGLYWDKDFNEEETQINCHYCQKIIYKNEKNQTSL
jgi:DNA-directed RNA polymerase subunit RPC12/RpoP